MIPSPVSIADLKIAQNKKGPASSKKEDKSFEQEMVNNERKLKKKNKLEGQELSGHAPQQKNPEQKMISADDKSTHSKKSSELASPREMEMQTGGEVAQDPSLAAANKTASEAVPPELMAKSIGAVTENSINPAFKEMMNVSGGKINLEGLEMLQAQALPVENLKSLEGPGIDHSGENPVDNLLKIVTESSGGKEKSLSDLLSQNSEKEGFAFDLNSEAMGQQLVHKDQATPAQIFANILENKTQNIEGVQKENIDHLVTQASTILKDGGGEMKLQLRPEGLGTVDLKVGVQDGQVSIEIMAQDKHVKKMFEDSVFEIRGALENQNLKIDTFKVGVSENFDQSLSQNASQFAQREFARDFMGQFRDERQSFRNQSLDNILTNRSPFQSAPEGLAPSSIKTNSNGRLNVIA